MTRRLFALLTLALLAPPLSAEETSESAIALDRAIMAEIKSKSEIIKNLTHLCDHIGARVTGSPSLKRANDWAAETMKAYGLENVKLEPYEIPVGWERGTATAKFVEPANGQSILVASLAWAPGTKGKVTGDVVIFTANKREDLAKYKGKLKDAIILRSPPRRVPSVMLPNALLNAPSLNPFGPAPRGFGGRPGGGAPEGRRPMGEFDPQRAFAQEVRDFLKAEGVAAVLQDSAKPHSLLVTTGGWRGRERAAEQETIATLYAAHEHYAQLWRLASRPAPAKTRIELEVTNKFIPGPITVYNTVGEIKGSEKPDEFVVVGAHLDSWDLAQGTTDNGTGTCAVLEAARAIIKAGVKPKRTIRFVLFTGEEQGLHGSRAYVERHKAELPKTSMALVHDTGTGRVLGIGLQGREVLKPIFDKELAALKDVGVKDINLRNMGGTDHLPFESAGVPGFACIQDPNEYRMTHHTQSDTLDKASEPDLVQGAQVLAVSAMRVANLPALLPREKPERRRPGGGN